MDKQVAGLPPEESNVPSTKQSAYSRSLESLRRWIKDDKKAIAEKAPLAQREARKRVYTGDAAISKNPAAGKYANGGKPRKKGC